MKPFIISIYSLAFNLLIYVSTRFMATCEGIMTSVIFEHALRIQLRDDSANKKKTASSTAPSESGEDEADKAPETEGEGEENEDDLKGNLVGKINQLMSSDLDSLINARTLCIDAVAAPVGLVISVISLYSILGWSSLCGLGFLSAETSCQPLHLRLTETSFPLCSRYDSHPG